ncbi:hypothetical protein [Priestia aryabhattai]|uniref:hypothetical protein n=1 Tax=Priestia aryabhattai TaxID=412384 RepID=UPI0015F5047D|nr:hypothetical protein [Priestia aryabhattai]
MSDMIAKAMAKSNATQLAKRANEIAWISVANFPIQSPETDDTARINRAIASITKGTVLVPDGVYNISGSGVTVPVGINLDMSPEAQFVYTGTGIALTLSGGKNSKHNISKIKKSALAWKTTDSTSTGLRIYHVNHSSITVMSIQDFYTGIELYGDSDSVGTCYNTIILGHIMDNKLGVSFKQSGSGWANGNTFIGGAIRINSNNGGITGTKYIDLSTTGNGNVFTGVNMEGSANEKSVDVLFSNNTFLNCRMELNVGNSWHFRAGSSNNQVIGGYGNNGFDTKQAGNGVRLFLDEGTGNLILGGRGLKLYGDNGSFGGDALVLEGITGGADVLLRGQNFNKQVFSTLNATGVYSFYAGTGKYDATTNPTGQVNPIIRINPTVNGGSIEVGGNSGNDVPTPLFSAYTAARTDLKKTLFNNGGRIAGSYVAMSGATPDVSTSNNFKTNNTSATTITDFNLGTTGQEIIIIGNDTFTTIANNSRIILQGGANVTLKVNDVIKLIKLDGSGVWVETARNIK